jgi:O-antigen ligase
VSVLAQPRLLGGGLYRARWVFVAGAAAVTLGLASSQNLTAGIAVAIVLAVVAATVVQPTSILAILILSVFLEVITFGGVTISRLIAPVALLVLLVELLRGGASLLRGPQLSCAIAYSMLAVASGLWTVSTSHTITLLASLAIALTYMLCFAGLLNSEEVLRRVLHILAFGSLLIGAWSLASFKGYSFVPGGSLQGGRGQGGVGDPNFFANLQLVAFPLILVLAADAKNRWLRYALGFTAFVTLASILSTLSRGGLVALILVVFLIPFVPARAFFPSRRQKALIMLVLTIGIGVLFSRPGFRGTVVKRATTIFSKQGAEAGSSAGSGRDELWKAAAHSIKERPFLGLGYGAFSSVSNDLLFRTPGVDLRLISPHPKGLETHSAYLGTAAELGLPGLALFLALILSTMLALRRTAVRARRAGALFLSRISNALVLSLIGWAVSSFFIETETARPLWAVIGISLALPKLVRDRAEAVRPEAQVGRIGFPTRQAP